MDDLDRLFNHLVAHLQEAAPDRLFKPWQVSELYQRLIPYRAHRRQLGLDSIEDYEMAVMRLLSGERGYAKLEPADAQEALAAEVEMPNPNPGAFREFAAATVILDSNAVRRVARDDAAYAPPASVAAPPAAPAPTNDRSNATAKLPGLDVADRKREIVFEPVPAASTCPHCAEALPADRDVIFCPFCGRQLEVTDCQSCGEPVAPEWSYCLACGAAKRRGRAASGG